MEWERYTAIAGYYRHRVPPEDRDDLVQTIVLEMAHEALRRDGQALPKAYLEAIAFHVVCGYWRNRKRKPLSLNRPVRGTEGIELGDTVADERTGDPDAQLDAQVRLEACPPGVQRIARKLEKGDPLTEGQWAYLLRFRRNGKVPLYWLKLYHRRRASGLCVACGQPAKAGFARCAECLERARRHQALYKRRKGLAWEARLREHWRNEGRCPRCGRPPQPGRKKCPHCLSLDREHLRHWREREAARGSGAPKREIYAREGGDNHEGLHKHRLGSL